MTLTFSIYNFAILHCWRSIAAFRKSAKSIKTFAGIQTDVSQINEIRCSLICFIGFETVEKHLCQSNGLSAINLTTLF